MLQFATLFQMPASAVKIWLIWVWLQKGSLRSQPPCHPVSTQRVLSRIVVAGQAIAYPFFARAYCHSTQAPPSMPMRPVSSSTE
jgi:hypothetical protein